jgi:hypothetical protein
MIGQTEGLTIPAYEDNGQDGKHKTRTHKFRPVFYVEGDGTQAFSYQYEDCVQQTKDTNYQTIEAVESETAVEREDPIEAFETRREYELKE